MLLLFSCSVMSESLQPHELQHARLPCPSLSPGICSNSHPLSRWCYPIISASVALFSCPQSFPASRSFPMRWLFASGGQSIGTSASGSILLMNIQNWLALRLTDLISVLKRQRTLKSLLQHRSSKASFLWHSAFFTVRLSQPHMTTRKTIAFIRWTFVGKVMSLLYNTLSRLVIAFLPRSKRPQCHGCSHHLQWFWRPRK